MKRSILLIGMAVFAFIMAFVVPVEPETPWESIGGCGAGGSGGGSGDGIKWVGQGVSGGLLTTELFIKKSVGQNFSSFSFNPRFSTKPFWNTEIGLSLPFTTHQGEVQYRSNQVPVDRTTGGVGDLSVDVSQIIGSGGAASISLALAIPTGQYDIKRGSDASLEFLPASFQKGSGLYSLTLGWNYSKDTDKGIWLYSLSYSHPFAMRLFSGKNEFNDSYWATLDTKGDDRFEYRFKYYGENDLGSYTPPSLSGSISYGYRGQRGFVHSVGLNLGVPIGVAWVASERVGTYDPRPDPDHQAWAASIVYGLEFSRMDYPLFFAISLPIHDKGEANSDDEYDDSPMRRWNAPDMSDFLQQWTLGFGIKGSFF